MTNYLLGVDLLGTTPHGKSERNRRRAAEHGYRAGHYLRAFDHLVRLAADPRISASAADYGLRQLAAQAWANAKLAGHYAVAAVGENVATLSDVRGERRAGCPDCDHPLHMHHRYRNGAYRCTSSGCGCEQADLGGTP